MLISKSLRTRILFLLVGSSILAGCKSAAPGSSFARFWPNRSKEESADEEQALSEKWRNRIRPSGDDNPYSRRGDSANDDPRNPSRGRLADRNRNNVRVPPQAETNWRRPESPPVNRSNIFDVYRNSNRQTQPADPFLQAELQDRSARQVSAQPPGGRGGIAAAGRTRFPTTTASRPARSGSRTVATPATAAAGEDDLPAWARELAPQSAVDAAAANANESLFGATRVRQEPAAAVAQADLPAWAQDVSPETAMTPPDNASPRRTAASDNRRTASANRPGVRTSEISKRAGLGGQASANTNQLGSSRSTVQRHPLNGVKPIIRPAGTPGAGNTSSIDDRAEQHRASVALDVSQLMKRSRIEARAGMMPEALKTAIAAEQLANSAGVRFSPNEQTPSELVQWLRTEAQKQSAIVKNAAETPSAPGANPPAAEAPQPERRSRVTIASGPKRWNSEFQRASAAKVPANDSDATEADDVSQSLWESSSHPKTAQRGLPRWNPNVIRSGSGTAQAGVHPVTHHSVGRHSETGARFASQTIYHPDNFRWVRLDESEATLLPGPLHNEADSDRSSATAAAAPPVPVKTQIATHRPSPKKKATPEKPAAGEKSSSAKPPLWRIALLGLSLLILLAAIVYRRRFMPLNV